VQRAESAATLYKPSHGDDEDAAWQDETIVPPPVSKLRTLLRMAGFVITMVGIGSGMAVAWEYSGLRMASANLAWPEFPSLSASAPAAPPAPAAAASKPQPDDQLARVTHELEGLKQNVAALTGAMQQLAATNAALQAGQQELRQRISSLPASSYWYSDHAALRLRFAIQHKPPAPAARAASQETTGSTRRSESAPLTLRAPQPDAGIAHTSAPAR
jgi:hypothetical protein